MRKAAHSVSADGQVEVHSSKVILHEPLASEMAALERETGRPFQQLLSRGLQLVEKEVQQENAILGKQSRKVKKPKARRG